MRLWISTCPDDFSAEFDDIEEMFRRGLTRLILDKRGRSLYNLTSSENPVPQESMYRRATADDYERWLLSLPMDLRDRIWVRGNPDMAEQLDVRGCVCEAQSFMGEVPESWKRINCVALCKDFEEVQKLPTWISGALVGPIFQPLSAIEPVKTLGSDFANSGASDTAAYKAFSPANIPLILYGGVDVDTIDDFNKFSPAGVMALGGIWNYADPINAFIKLNRACGNR